jgi:hypothetical protein
MRDPIDRKNNRDTDDEVASVGSQKIKNVPPEKEFKRNWGCGTRGGFVLAVGYKWDVMPNLMTYQVLGANKGASEPCWPFSLYLLTRLRLGLEGRGSNTLAQEGIDKIQLRLCLELGNHPYVVHAGIQRKTRPGRLRQPPHIPHPFVLARHHALADKIHYERADLRSRIHRVGMRKGSQ